MRVCVALAVLGALLVADCLAASSERREASSGRVLRRVVRKSAPFGHSRIKAITVRSTNENGAAVEISPLEAHNFGKRATPDSSPAAAQKPAPLKAEKPEPTTPSPATSTSAPASTTTARTTTTTTTTTTAAPKPQPSSTTSTAKPFVAAKAHEPQPQSQLDAMSVELMASAPSLQVMTAVETPRIALESSPAVEEADVLRSVSAKGGPPKPRPAFFAPLVVKQQQARTSKTSSQQQAVSKTSNFEQTKTSTWYRPTTTTTPRPEPIVQQQHYEQQQVDYGAAPVGQAEPFAFDFKTEDDSGNGQYRKEESDKDGVVRGSYGYTDASGIYRHVSYIADKDGFRANIKSNEPGMDGEVQPASIQLASSATPVPKPESQRSVARPVATAAPSSEPDWTSSSSNNNAISNKNEETADLSAWIDPNFESSHKPERVVSNKLRNF